MDVTLKAKSFVFAVPADQVVFSTRPARIRYYIYHSIVLSDGIHFFPSQLKVYCCRIQQKVHPRAHKQDISGHLFYYKYYKQTQRSGLLYKYDQLTEKNFRVFDILLVQCVSHVYYSYCSCFSSCFSRLQKLLVRDKTALKGLDARTAGLAIIASPLVTVATVNLRRSIGIVLLVKLTRGGGLLNTKKEYLLFT